MDFKHILEAFNGSVKYLPNTILITSSALLVGILIGFLLALIQFNKINLISKIIRVFIVIFKAVPIIVMILITYLIVSPKGNQVTLIAIFVLSVFTSVRSSEMWLGSLKAIPISQYEAADALGFTKTQTLVHIVLPQSFKIAIPMFGNLSISTLKATSLLSMISITEILMGALIEANTNFKYLESYIAAAIVYWLLTVLIESLIKIYEYKSLNIYID